MNICSISAACAGLLCLWLAQASCPAAASADTTVRVEPRQTDELLANPGMGWQTFMRFADQDKNLQGLPSTSAYFRFYWREIEPRDGEIDFAKFDELLAHARRAGQKLAFRIMCTGSDQYMDVPAWLKESGCPGVEFNYGGGKRWAPDFAAPRFKNAHLRLIRELGARYDGHPDLDLVDIGSVGLWGEWHMSGTSEVGTGKPVPLPPLAERMAIIDAWCQAFPKTSKVILIGSEEGMARARTDHYGWRADCFGDMGGFSKNWNHMENMYLQQLARTGAQEVWQEAPVAFESCWDMRKWKEAGWDIRAIFDYGLRCHASYLNNKSAPLPAGAREEVERFLRCMGYRLVIRRVEHPAKARPDSDLRVKIAWENVGVAPPYRDCRVAFRLKALDSEAAGAITAMTEQSIRHWQPGTREMESSIRVPKAIQAGRYGLAVAVVDPADQKPAVRLAIAGRDAEGWYSVSQIQIER